LFKRSSLSASASHPLDRAVVRAEAMRHDWSRVAASFLTNIYQSRRAAGFNGSASKAKGQSPQIKQSPKPIA
jgi:hypothetical protein